MRRRRARAFRPVVLLAAAVTLFTLWPRGASFDDVATLAAAASPPSPAERWRLHLVAAPVPATAGAALDSFDPRLNSETASRVSTGTGFLLTDALPPQPRDGTAAPRGDRLALSPAVAARLHYLATADDDRGAAYVRFARGGATPESSARAATTPGDDAVPVATAALPVQHTAPLLAVNADPLLQEARAAGAILRLSTQAPIAPADLPKAEKCMATAIYFEARGEPVRGQYAVAQVVMNRLRSPDYPKTVCGVVYQNADWYDHCQFSFACDGRSERVFDRAAWKRAERIAADVIVRGVYLPDVGTATNYHADYVRPRWARYMVKTEKLGRHIFYNDPSIEGDSAPLAFADR
jgi:spore germination cell wall hydrolase CwlJ-like protein